MADITDKFLSIGRRGTLTTLEAPGKPIGAPSLKIKNPANWSAESLIAFSIRRVYVGGENDGKEVPASYTEWTGVLNPEDGSIDSLSLESGEDQAYGSGPDVQVFIHISTTWAEKLVEGLLTSLDRAGRLKNEVVQAIHLAVDSVTTDKVKDGAVTGPKIGSSAITPEKMNQEAFDGAWTPIPAGSGHASSVQAREVLGIVYLKGTVTRSGSNIANGQYPFESGAFGEFAPSNTAHGVGIALRGQGSGNTSVKFRINSNGSMQVISDPTAPTNNIVFDGISYLKK